MKDEDGEYVKDEFDWRRSSFAPPDADAVEAAYDGEFIRVSWSAGAACLKFSTDEWDDFVKAVKNGEYDHML